MVRGFRFAIDRGGTFTDVYAESPSGEVSVIKLLSNDSANYPDAPREGIRRVLRDFYAAKGIPFASDDAHKDVAIPTADLEWIRMGTTVATNALLEREGFPFILVTTTGLGDVLRIGNQSRSFIFDLQMRKTPVLYQRVIEARERVRIIKSSDSPPLALFPGTCIKETLTGEHVEIMQPLDETHIEGELQKAFDEGFRSVAVALIHSYCFPEHEKRIGEIAKAIGFEQVSLSSQIMPMVRLVPRGQTTCVDAYLTPLISEYLRGFLAGFDSGIMTNVDVSFMMSDGGLCPMESFFGFRAILSGPAGGVVGYARTTYSEKSGSPVIGFDMGGTSTDVSRFDGKYSHVYDTQTAGVTIQAPQLDIQTVAAGGGSKLQFRAGMMQVGPGSVGAQP